jgi:transposase
MKTITPNQYDQIKDVLPVQRGNVEIDNIVFLNAILYVAENGCKWRSIVWLEYQHSQGIWVLVHHLHADATLGRQRRLDSRPRSLANKTQYVT